MGALLIVKVLILVIFEKEGVHLLLIHEDYEQLDFILILLRIHERLVVEME